MTSDVEDQGARENLLRLWADASPGMHGAQRAAEEGGIFAEYCSSPHLPNGTGPKLLFGLSVLHCLLAGRGTMGKMGWNTRWRFTDEDLALGAQIGLMLVEQYGAVKLAEEA